MCMIKKHENEIRNARCFNTKEYQSIFSKEEQKKYQDFILQRIPIEEKKEISLSDMLQDVINELEHCSISFNSGLADDRAVYQSMHQVIFKLFPCVYPWIGFINNNGVDLYYTNLCELYVRWNQIRKKALRKELKANRKLARVEQNYRNSGKVKTPKI